VPADALTDQRREESEAAHCVEVCREQLARMANIKALEGGSLLNLLTIGTTLGMGTFGRVRLAHIKGRGIKMQAGSTFSADRSRIEWSHAMPNVFALKIMKKAEILKLKQVEHIRNEKEILRAINHPFLVTLYAVAQDMSHVYMLLEFVIGGELFTRLRTVGKFANDHGRFYAGQITLCMQYLHEQTGQGCIIYRDLKPENVLFDDCGYIKMTDFGFAKRIEDRTWTLCGTPEYLAPEIIQSKGHGKAVDWWAFGVLIYEMLAGYPPFYDDNPFGIYQLILAGRIQFPRNVDTHARDLVRKLLALDRCKRLGCLQDGGKGVRAHRWFRGLDFDALYWRQLEAPFVPLTHGDEDTSQFEEYPDSTTTCDASSHFESADMAAFADF